MKKIIKLTEIIIAAVPKSGCLRIKVTGSKTIRTGRIRKK